MSKLHTALFAQPISNLTHLIFRYVTYFLTFHLDIRYFKSYFVTTLRIQLLMTLSIITSLNYCKTKLICCLILRMCISYSFNGLFLFVCQRNQTLKQNPLSLPIKLAPAANSSYHCALFFH